GGRRHGCGLARARTAVVPRAVEVDPRVRRRRVDLEGDRITPVDADVGREAQNVAVAGPGDVPARVSRQTVFGHDGVGGRGAIAWSRRWRRSGRRSEGTGGHTRGL